MENESGNESNLSQQGVFEELKFFKIERELTLESIYEACPAPNTDCRICIFGGSPFFNNLFCLLLNDIIENKNE